MPTLHKSTSEAALQLTRNNARWAGVLGDGYGPLTFGFRTVAPSYTVSDQGDVKATFSPFTPAEQAAARAAFGLWAAVANVIFIDLGDSDGATIELGNYSSTTDKAEGFAFFPGPTAPSSRAGDVFININYASTTNLAPGTYEFNVLLHEIGHTLGLEHPGDYDADGGSNPTYDANAVYVEDSRMYTVMSYFGSRNTGGSLSVFAETPQLHDIAAVQRLYGPNPNTRSEDTVYGFFSNAGAPFSISSANQKVAFTVYDASGRDTLNFSGYSQNQTIDLRAEHFSSVGGDTFNVNIAQGVVIEAAVGGTGADTIIGNAVSNTLDGGPGADRLFGMEGDDVLIGGGGADQLTGGPGADVFRYLAASDSTATAYDVITDFQSGLDKIDLVAVGPTAVRIEVVNGESRIVVETPAGSMEIYVQGDRVVGSDIVAGNAAIAPLGLTLTGDENANVLTGGEGNDLITGLGGADILTGGGGADVFRYLSASDSTASAMDLITDFQTGLDRLDLSAIAPTQTSLVRSGAGTLVFSQGASGPLTVIAVNGTIQGGDVVQRASATSVTPGVDMVGQDGSADMLIGTAGPDKLFGLSGSDWLDGGAGDDQLFGDAGADVLTGGPGADRFAYRGFSDSNATDGYDIITDFLSGTDKIDFTYLNGLTSVALVRLSGSTFVFAATDGGLIQVGLIGLVQGTDLINPAGSATSFGYDIIGESGADTLLGSAGNDRLYGLAGDDVLVGGGGADLLTGGPGADTFVYTAVSDSTPAAFDRILDFQSGIDKIDLRAVHSSPADKYGVATQNGDTYLFVDRGGDGVSEMLIVFAGITGVQASDILW